MKYLKVVDGLTRYIDREIVPLMNDNQQTGYVIICEMLNDESYVLDKLKSNAIIRGMLSIDKDGNINVDRLHTLLKASIKRKEKFVLDVPFFGKFTLTESDIDSIFTTIKELDK